MKECKYCGSFYADNLSACPNCGGSKIITAAEKAAEEKMYIKEIRNQEKSVPAPVETEKKRTPKLGVALGVAVAVVAIIIVIFAGSGSGNPNGNNPNNPNNPTPQIDATFEAGQKYYNTGNYKEAIGKLFAVSVDSDYYEDAQAMLADSIEKYKAATVDKVNTYIISNKYDDAFSLIADAQTLLPEDSALKTAYNSTYTAYIDFVIAQADVHSQAADYEAAMSVLNAAKKKYSEEIRLETSYNIAYAAYVDAVIAKADSYSQTADYKTAIGILNTAKNKYPNDTRLDACYVSTFAAYKTLVCTNAISEADTFASNGDYPSAITAIDNAVELVGHDDELTAKRDVLVEEYRNALFAESVDALSTSGYEKAIAVLNDGLVVLGDDELILCKIEEYKTYAPVELMDMETFSGYNSSTIRPITDTFGNEYNHAYSVWTALSSDEFSVLLNGKYNVLSGLIVWSKEDKNNSGRFSLQFYDGDRLVYSTDPCSAASGPVEFSCSVSNINILTIKFEAFSTDGPFDQNIVTLTVQK